MLTDSVSKETDKASKKNEPVSPEKTSSIQIIEYDQPVSAGGQVSFSFLLSDDEIRQPVEINFQKADFTGPADQKVSSKQISIQPSTILLNPGEEKEITILVKLPRICLPGHYNSILTIQQMPAAKIILSFQVK
ncbi:MAG: hypothetical protein EOO01_37035 [Chitinophagaceae bacterium]|nr:MAG: hypothetical protein EOO01_37035 [Chitinophagaceae bacterium]